MSPGTKMTKKSGDSERKPCATRPGGEGRQDKQVRLARALRANLARRKAQARARAERAESDKDDKRNG